VDLHKIYDGALNSCIRSRIAVRGFLWIRYCTFGIHKIRGILRVSEELLRSQEGPFSRELIS